MTVRQTGFSLIEIAVVLVILGLMLGAVLKGQELVSGARVRYLIRQQDDLKVAYLAFFDPIFPPSKKPNGSYLPPELYRSKTPKGIS